MPVNDFLEFSTTPGANVASQGSYLNDPTRLVGNTTGLLRSPFVNKTQRQASVIAAAWGQIITTELNEDALDDGNFGRIVSQLIEVIKQVSGSAIIDAPADGSGWLRMNNSWSRNADGGTW